MKIMIYAAAAAVIVFAAMGCSKKDEETYADKLVNGEVQPDVEYSDDAENETENETEDETEQPEGTKVDIAVSDDEMASLIDGAASEYTSFEFIPIDTPDFFLNKNLRMAASVSEHQLSNVYAANIKTIFTEDSMTMSYVTDGNTTSNEYYVYAVSDEIKTTPSGIEYTYIAYGDQPITSEETEGTIGVVANVKLSGVDMGEASADSYVFLIETSNPGMYELFMEE